MDYTKRSIKQDEMTVMRSPEWKQFIEVDIELDEALKRTHRKTRREAELASAVVAKILNLPNSHYTRNIGIACMNIHYCGNRMGI